MTRTLLDADFHTWEVYPTGGPFGFPDKPKVVFNCLTDADRRPRWVPVSGDNADAERMLSELAPEDLQKLLDDSIELR